MYEDIEDTEEIAYYIGFADGYNQTTIMYRGNYRISYCTGYVNGAEFRAYNNLDKYEVHLCINPYLIPADRRVKDD